MAATLAHELNQVMTAATNFVNASRRLLASGDHHKIETVPKVMDEAAAEILRAGPNYRAPASIRQQG
jgi:two-component system sensor kinase FixL